MGPRPIRRGNCLDPVRYNQNTICFNGATSNQTWKQPRRVGKDVPQGASMGPRPIRRGNVNSGCGNARSWVSFNGATSNQTWKQTFSTLSPAPMTVLQWGHVQSDVETTPRSSPLHGGHWLQWGHVQSDVETRIEQKHLTAFLRLQWGHVQSDVETKAEAPL